jgi:hypothetical protein
MRSARDQLDLECEIVYLRTLISIAARDKNEQDGRELRHQLAEAGALHDSWVRNGDVRDTPMARLVARHALTPKQTELLWAIIATSADPRLAIPLEALWGASSRRGLSVAAYAHLRGLPAEDGRDLALWLAQRSTMVGSGLIVASDISAPASNRSYIASERLLGYVLGDDAPSPPLRQVTTPEVLVLDPAQQAALEQLIAVLRNDNAVIVIEGPRGSGRSTAVARASGVAVVELDGARRERVDQQSLLELRREVGLGVAQPVIGNADRLPPELGLGAFLDSTRGAIVVTSAMPGLDLGTDRPIVRVRWPLPETSVRRTLWQSTAHDPTGDLETLAFRYRVGAGIIHRAVASVRAEHGAGRKLDAADLAAGLRHNIAEDLGGLAHPVEVTQSWDDLVLADDTRDHIQALIARVRHAHQVLATWGYRAKIARGTGVPALFSGPPGTGKTMVAGLIARELDLELYQVDLSQVVSKWVGETEKQLARVFDAAEQGHALLLFDEADALFGKRTADVKGANDRYANLEVNYLLQRVEAFGGITILTTNLDTAIEPALKRRLAAHVVFELPDDDERSILWQRNVTTAAAPLAKDLDFEQLSRTFPKMSGANIRNAALAAAFLAAAEKTSTITQQHLLRAGRAEYRSMGHVLAERRGV